MNIRVLVVDDEPLARVGITTRLSAYSDMVIVGECSTGEEALTKIPQVSPDLIFVAQRRQSTTFRPLYPAFQQQGR